MRETYEGSIGNDHGGHGDFFMGVLIGGAIGAAVALLYAPVRGRDAREMIGDRLQDGLDGAAATVERGRELAAQGRDWVEQGKALAAEGRETVARAVADGRDAYRRVKADA